MSTLKFTKHLPLVTAKNISLFAFALAIIAAVRFVFISIVLVFHFSDCFPPTLSTAQAWLKTFYCLMCCLKRQAKACFTGVCWLFHTTLMGVLRWD
jgi:hypothetical protein